MAAAIRVGDVLTVSTLGSQGSDMPVPQHPTRPLSGRSGPNVTTEKITIMNKIYSFTTVYECCPVVKLG